MKRIANPIETTELCSYGCGNVAKFINGSQKLMCTNRSNSCPAVRERNSQKIKIAHAEGRIPTEQLGPSQGWNKGKTFVDPDNVFIYGGRGPIKKLLLETRGHRCQKCQNTLWNDLPIPLEIEHIDGDSKNNVRENLLLLCPNCHAQTPTWRRPKTKTYDEQKMIEAIKTSPSLSACLRKLGMKWGSSSTVERCRMRHNLQYADRGT